MDDKTPAALVPKLCLGTPMLALGTSRRLSRTPPPRRAKLCFAWRGCPRVARHSHPPRRRRGQAGEGGRASQTPPPGEQSSPPKCVPKRSLGTRSAQEMSSKSRSPRSVQLDGSPGSLKPWGPRACNGNGGKMHVDFSEKALCGCEEGRYVLSEKTAASSSRYADTDFEV